MPAPRRPKSLRSAALGRQATGDLRLTALGSAIRVRRVQRGLSLRALAGAAGISSSYLGAIELGSNPATGRPPSPSLRVLVALTQALQLESSALISIIEPGGQGEHPDAAHMLLYVMQDRPGNIFDHVVRVDERATEQWVYIPDPRLAEFDASAAHERIGLVCAWPFGSDPYPDRTLKPARLLTTLERDLRVARNKITGARVGLAIADCSAVMRWVTNPHAEIEFESTWANDADRVFRRALNRSPSANVCVYHHSDIEALGLEIDGLATVTHLLTTHDTINVLDHHGRLHTGAPAAVAMLREFKPPGVSTPAWHALCAAAAAGMAGARGRTTTQQIES
jgi:transcriptional regulator with XRE-family HTH domain